MKEQIENVLLFNFCYYYLRYYICTTRIYIYVSLTSSERDNKENRVRSKDINL